MTFSNAERQRRSHEKHPFNWRINTLWSRFGLRPNDWDNIFASQGQACGCCGGTDPMHKMGWRIDHDHAKKKGDRGFIRGIVCHPCNLMLHKHATPRTLRLGAQYMEKVR
jgi:Recombination endonuclease VII